MPVEIELKVRVDDLRPIRAQLSQCGAKRLKLAIETDTFFDTPDGALMGRDSGLRLRHDKDLDSGQDQFLLTHKGPLQPGPIKTRAEHQVSVAGGEEMVGLLKALGFQPVLSFDKRRETWSLDNCLVALDELPQLGNFVEIEGPDEPSIRSAAIRLGLSEIAPVTRGYASMIAEMLDQA